jgi:hypothetical protein
VDVDGEAVVVVVVVVVEGWTRDVGSGLSGRS